MELRKNILMILLILTLIVSRIGLYLLLLATDNFMHGGDLGVFVWISEETLNGKIIYRDYPYHKSPYYPFLTALPLSLWHYRGSIILFFMILDLSTVYLLFLTAEKIFNKEEATKICLLYAINPLTWYGVLILSQDEIVLCFFLTLALYLFYSKRETEASIVLGIGIAFTKAIFLVLIIPILLAMEKRPKKLLTTTLTAFLLYLPFIIIRANIFSPFQFTKRKVYHMNIWGLLEKIGLLGSSNQEIMIILTIFGTTMLLSYIYLWNQKEQNILTNITIVFLLFMLLYKEVFSFYALTVLPIWLLTFCKNNKTNSFLISFYGIGTIAWYYFMQKYLPPPIPTTIETLLKSITTYNTLETITILIMITIEIWWLHYTIKNKKKLKTTPPKAKLPSIGI